MAGLSKLVIAVPVVVLVTVMGTLVRSIHQPALLGRLCAGRSCSMLKTCEIVHGSDHP
jgi:hypothetical protein